MRDVNDGSVRLSAGGEGQHQYQPFGRAAVALIVVRQLFIPDGAIGDGYGWDPTNKCDGPRWLSFYGGGLYWSCHLAYMRAGNIGGTNSYIYAAATSFLWENWRFNVVGLSQVQDMDLKKTTIHVNVK